MMEAENNFHNTIDALDCLYARIQEEKDKCVAMRLCISLAIRMRGVPNVAHGLPRNHFRMSYNNMACAFPIVVWITVDDPMSIGSTVYIREGMSRYTVGCVSIIMCDDLTMVERASEGMSVAISINNRESMLIFGRDIFGDTIFEYK
jgi:hypothetical protein